MLRSGGVQQRKPWEVDTAQSQRGRQMESGRKPGDLTCNEGQCHGRVDASKFTEALEVGPEVEYNTLYLVRSCSSISLTAQKQRA